MDGLIALFEETATHNGEPVAVTAKPKPAQPGLVIDPATAVDPMPRRPVQPGAHEPTQHRPAVPVVAIGVALASAIVLTSVALFSDRQEVSTAIVQDAAVQAPRLPLRPGDRPQPVASPSPMPASPTPQAAGSPKTRSSKADSPTTSGPPATLGEPPPQPSSFARFASANSGRCINVAGEDRADGARVIQWNKSWLDSCSGAHEQWSWVGGYGPDGSMFKVVNKNSGKCLDIAGDTAGADVVQRTCHDSSGSQVWSRTYETVYNGWRYYRPIVNHRCGLCLDNRGDTTDGAPAGVPLRLWPCANIGMQQFRIPE